IRDLIVTGVQTCALPISVVEEHHEGRAVLPAPAIRAARIDAIADVLPGAIARVERTDAPGLVRRQDREREAGLGEDVERLVVDRSEERRVGKEWRVRGWR